MKNWLKENLFKRLKTVALAISVWGFMIYLIQATTDKCGPWDDDCGVGKVLISFALTVLTIFLWKRLSKKFNF